MTARVLVVQHEDRVPLARFATMPGVPLDVVRPDRGEPLPATADGYHGVIVLGGTMAAWQDAEFAWLPATRALLASCVADGTPVLGVCLGAQLLALATGGSVERGVHGPHLGVQTVRVTAAGADDALTGGLADAFLAPQGHHDAITALPPGAVLLATSDKYPHQAFRLGSAAWGVQYHPEVDAETFEDWMAGDAEHLAAAGSSVAQETARFAACEDALARSADAHATAFAEAVTGHAGAVTRTRVPAAAAEATGA